MRTPDMSDEELDALFQRSAENYPDEHNLSAWLQMERKLDEAAVQHLVRRRVLRLFVIETLVVALGLLLWLGLRTPAAQQPLAAATPVAGPAASPAASTAATPVAGPQRKPETAHTTQLVTTPALAAPTKSIENEPAAPAAASNPVTRPTAAQSTPRRPLLIAPLITTGRKPRATDQPESGLATATIAATPTPAGAARKHRALSRGESGAKTPLLLATTTSDAAKGNVPTRKHSQPESSPASPAGLSTPVLAPGTPATNPATRVSSETVAPEAAVAAAPQPGGEPLPGRPSGATPADSTALPATAAPLVQPAAASPVVASAPTDSTKPAPLTPQYRLSLGILVAPELSAVRGVQGAGLGSNVGVLLEYRLTNRLRINVAALRSLKRYSARGSDYHPPAGYWSNNYTIDRIDATCRITDLPLNLRYDLVQRPTATIFASAGLSTLLMRSERYIYAYEYYGKPASRDWTLLNGSNHYLSVVNLLAGYERALHGRWSAQAEPFVKIPLGGVGFGKIKLSSAGVFFSLKYGLVPAAPRPTLP